MRSIFLYEIIEQLSMRLIRPVFHIYNILQHEELVYEQFINSMNTTCNKDKSFLLKTQIIVVKKSCMKKRGSSGILDSVNASSVKRGQPDSFYKTARVV